MPDSTQLLNDEARQEFLEVLRLLTDTLLDLQIKDPQDPDCGAFPCPETSDRYSRAAETVYPFAVMFKITGESRYCDNAFLAARWLIARQREDGAWEEGGVFRGEVSDWTGTTADQLIMMASAYPLLKNGMDSGLEESWKQACLRAAAYLSQVMSPAFASINYVATTAAALAVTYDNISADDALLEKARVLARQVYVRMDDDGFIHGEGGRAFGIKYGVDFGYQMDMSLWGLTVYARIAGDTEVENAVRESLKRAVHFIYPHGALDGSWAVRSGKWTGYGSLTADGSTVLFSLFADEDPVYLVAALRNLDYLRTCIRDGMIGYGQHIWSIDHEKPNIHPTFMRAKSMAMALEWGRPAKEPPPPLPSDRSGWMRYFPTVKVALVRTRNFMATVSAYDYRDYTRAENDNKYTYYPRGGALCNLWLEGYGFLQTSSQTRYYVGETVYPLIDQPLQPLTPRIEFTCDDGYFTNLYESAARMDLEEGRGAFRLKVRGELCDWRNAPGGVAYGYDYSFSDDSVSKTVTLRCHNRQSEMLIYEPIVMHEDARLERVDDNSIMIYRDDCAVRFSLQISNIPIVIEIDPESVWHPLPGLRCWNVYARVGLSESCRACQLRLGFTIVKP